MKELSLKTNRFVVICFLFLSLIGCGQSKDSGDLVVGTSADNPPYEFVQDGKVVGLDIDVVNAIGKHLGKKVVIKNMDFHGLIASLVNKQVDLVIAGLSVTPEREARVQFSRTYTNATIAVLYRKDDKILSKEDLHNKTVGAQLGTIWAQVARDLSTKYGLKIESLSNNLMLVEQLKSKSIDAVILEAVQAAEFVNKNPSLGSFLLTDISSQFAIAMRHKSKLQIDINNSLNKLEEDGTLAKIREKWLGSKAK